MWRLLRAHPLVVVPELLRPGALPEEHHGHVRSAKRHWRVHAADCSADPVRQEPLKLVHIVAAPAHVAHVLRVHGPCLVPPEAEAHHERVLGPHRRVVLRVPRHGEVDNTLLVLVAQQAKHDKRHVLLLLPRRRLGPRRVHRALCGAERHIADPEAGTHARRHTLKQGAALHPLARLAKVVELEQARIVLRQVLVRVPVARVQALEPAVARKPLPGRNRERGIDLVGELRIGLLFLAFFALALLLLAELFDRRTLLVLVDLVLALVGLLRRLVLLVLLVLLLVHVGARVAHQLFVVFLLIFFLLVVLVPGGLVPGGLVASPRILVHLLLGDRPRRGAGARWRRGVGLHVHIAGRGRISHLFFRGPRLLVGHRIRLVLAHELVGLLVALVEDGARHQFARLLRVLLHRLARIRLAGVAPAVRERRIGDPVHDKVAVVGDVHEAVRAERNAADPATHLERAAGLGRGRAVRLVADPLGVLAVDPGAEIAPGNALGRRRAERAHQHAPVSGLVEHMHLLHLRAKVLHKARQTLAHTLGVLGVALAGHRVGPRLLVRRLERRHRRKHVRHAVCLQRAQAQLAPGARLNRLLR